MNSLPQFENNNTEYKQKDRSNVIIKIIFPVISILIVLIGLIVLYQAGNVDQYITNEMRVGFGYFLSFGLLTGYLFEKVRSTVFAQIVLSATLSALTLTTIIATHGYKIFPHFIGLAILGVLFFVGLFLARAHTSEIEFSTSTLIGLSIPFFYSLDSFFVILVLEVIVIGALYLFLFFFKKVRFLDKLVLFVHILLSLIIIVQYIIVFRKGLVRYDWVFNLYELLQLMLLWVPFFYFRRQFVHKEAFKILTVITTVFCVVLALPYTLFQVTDAPQIRLHFMIVYAVIALFLFIQALLLKEEENSILWHSLSYIVFALGLFIFFEPFNFKLAALLIFTFLHMWLLNSLFLTDTKSSWNVVINWIFGILGCALSISIIVYIFVFVLRLPIVETAPFHERFIPPTVLILTYWFAYFFIERNRTFSFQKGLVLAFSWFFTALYFLYIPWQLMQLAFNGNPTIQLIILSVLWIVAAYVATLIGLKKGRIGLRIFTLVIFAFLLLKIIVVDVSVFWEREQMLGFAIYAIVFGIVLLVLSRLLIKEFMKNGSLKDEWKQLKDAFTIQKKRPSVENSYTPQPTFVPPTSQPVYTNEPFLPNQSVYTNEPFLPNQPVYTNEPFSPEQPLYTDGPTLYAPNESAGGMGSRIDQANGNFEHYNVEGGFVQNNPLPEVGIPTPIFENTQMAPEDTNVAPTVINQTQAVTPNQNPDEVQAQIAKLVTYFEEQGKFNDNYIMQMEMHLEIQQMYIDSQKKMNKKMNEIVESLNQLKKDTEVH